MKGPILAAVLLLTTLAGCAESPVLVQDDTSFDDVSFDADETTGVILGVVVDTSIVPIAGATIALPTGGTVRSQTSDELGRFVFEKVEPGTYFLTASAPLHEDAQFSAEVVAGESQPPVVKVQLTRTFAGDPYINQFHDQGFFPCTQAGVPGYLYSSSPCHSVAGGARLCEDLDLYCPEQARTFHNDVDAGWQTLMWEMTWESTATGTSERMGIVVSSHKETRDGAHYFAEYEGADPIVGRLDCCEPHPTSNAAGGDPAVIPSEGWKDMSYFMSVRPAEDAVCVLYCAPPGLALEQDFDVYHTQAYYLPLPVEWSFLAGDPLPY